jgi:hypothetical protein
MASNNELQTSRLTNASAGSTIDDAIRDIEACLRTILGASADSVLSAIMSMGTGPDVTFLGTVTLDAAPAADLQAATKKYVDDNISAGVVRFLGGLYTQSVADSTWEAIDWANISDHNDSGSWSVSGSNDGLIPPEEGIYVVQVSATAASGAGSIQLKLDGDDDDATAMTVVGDIDADEKSVSIVRAIKLASPGAASNIDGQVYQDTGGTKNVTLTASIYRIASAA